VARALPFDPEAVPGFLDPEEGRVLYALALEAARLGPCLEIGSYCGKSAIYLGTACASVRAVLYSIDHHSGSEEHQPGELYHDATLVDPLSGRVNTFPYFQETLRQAGLEHTVVPVVAASALAARAWSTPLGMVFIDGGHSREAARVDYEGWSPHIVPGGFLAVHDVFLDPGEGGQAPREIFERGVDSGEFECLGVHRTLGVLRRRPLA